MTTQATTDHMEVAAANIAHLAYAALQDIALLSHLVLNHLETPGEMSDAETAARVMEMIESKAEDAAAMVDAEARKVGITVELVRRERRKAAMARMFAPAGEGAAC